MTGCGQSAVLIAVSEIQLGTPAARPQQPSSPVQDCWKIEDDQIEVEKFIQNDKLVKYLNFSKIGWAASYC